MVANEQHTFDISGVVNLKHDNVGFILLFENSDVPAEHSLAFVLVIHLLEVDAALHHLRIRDLHRKSLVIRDTTRDAGDRDCANDGGLKVDLQRGTKAVRVGIETDRHLNNGSCSERHKDSGKIRKRTSSGPAAILKILMFSMGTSCASDSRKKMACAPVSSPRWIM